ncbi:MAG TPA: SOS response-associated peptidase [Anaerolineales bacterium]|nr:SOS response-associated peptidase [Anaerolineales bacterium]
MCGRFTLTADPQKLRATFPWATIPPEITPRYNIAPTQPVAVIANDGRDQLDFYTWGLIPSWAKDPAIGARMINARAETLAEKPSFRAAYRRRRCLILSDGFYEWKKLPGQKNKQPVYLRLSTGAPFAFGGLWERWDSADGSTIFSCTIITTGPNELVADVHNRMPLILPPEAYRRWLAPQEMTPLDLDPLLRPFPAEEMQAYNVSTLVNNPVNEDPACIVPWT